MPIRGHKKKKALDTSLAEWYEVHSSQSEIQYVTIAE